MLKWLKIAAYILIGVPLMACSVIYFGFRGSLPELEGVIETSSISAPVMLERDEYGNATITAQNRSDLSYVSGYLHAQERFFQMDLSRRLAAGELSELFGSLAVSTDRGNRVHRFRSRATVAIDLLSDFERLQLDQYTSGVNDGLADLGAKPFEYWLLNTEPKLWTREDSFLAIYSMYFTLQSSDGDYEWQNHLLRESLPDELSEFLLPLRTHWDAPILEETAIENANIPDSTLLQKGSVEQIKPDDTPMLGSNNWAVSGKLTETGSGMISNDMHLTLRAPSIWYKLRLRLADGSLDITGVSLPGVPAIVVGSNGHIAWGFTNSNIDHSDLIEIRINPENDNQYLTDQGYLDFEIQEEIINIADGRAETILVKETEWGPVIEMPDGAEYVYRWVAHMPDGVNLELFNFERAKSVNEAVSLAGNMAIPAQNTLIVDKDGNIAWTLFGKIPRRPEGDYSEIQDWSDGKQVWNDWYPADESPRIINPEHGRLWTANARVVSGDDFKKVGYSRYDLGARAGQIKQRLFELDYPIAEKDLYDIMLDDEAIFLERWQSQLVEVLEASNEEAFSPFLEKVRNWGGRADKSSVGFRLVREYRSQVFSTLMAHAVQACSAYNENCDYNRATKQWEQPLWQLVSERPDGWLPGDGNDWQFYFEQQAFEAWKSVMVGEIKLENYTWGAKNITKIAHPLSRAVPDLAEYIDMPIVEQSGDSENIPHITGRVNGQSIRMVVSPGHEEDGIMDLPSGQSGHPLSPYFGAGHEEWLNGGMLPFLPGETKWSLEFLPAQ